jgi:5-methylcytosine-specific restriction enzyme A
MMPCLEPGCPTLVERGRCPACDQQRRGSAAARGYDADWQVVRDAYARAHPLCEDHLERGEVVPMALVDHKIPLPYGPRLDPRNLRSLCASCHAVKSLQDQAAGYRANAAPSGRRAEEDRWILR